MKEGTTLQYMQTVIVSLLNERDSRHPSGVDNSSITSTDPEAPLFAKGSSFSPINIRFFIKQLRQNPVDKP